MVLDGSMYIDFVRLLQHLLPVVLVERGPVLGPGRADAGIRLIEDSRDQFIKERLEERKGEERRGKERSGESETGGGE